MFRNIHVCTYRYMHVVIKREVMNLKLARRGIWNGPEVKSVGENDVIIF